MSMIKSAERSNSLDTYFNTKTKLYMWVKCRYPSVSSTFQLYDIINHYISKPTNDHQDLQMMIVKSNVVHSVPNLCTNIYTQINTSLVI